MTFGRLIGTWVALMLLLTATVWVTVLPIGAWRAVINLLIAGAKGALVLAVFMKLREQNPLVRLMAAMAAVLLMVMAAMLTADYNLRPPADARMVAPLPD